MKNIKLILVLVIFICIPATACAAVYQDKANNFQMNIPDNWITSKENTFLGNVLVINHPTIKQTSIFMVVSDEIANQDPRKTLEEYSQQEIAALVESMKTEISSLIPEVVFEDAKTHRFPKNRAIQLNYTDGSKEYCITEFLLHGNIYMLVFIVPTQEYAQVSPAFFNMLDSIKEIVSPNDKLTLKDIPTV